MPDQRLGAPVGASVNVALNFGAELMSQAIEKTQVESTREDSSLAVLRALIIEAWPKIMALSPEAMDSIPEPVMTVLTRYWSAGALGLLPHEDVIADARSRADWAEAVAASHAKALDRLAAAADIVHERTGTKKVTSCNRFGHPIRDYQNDLDAVEKLIGMSGAAGCSSKPKAAKARTR